MSAVLSSDIIIGDNEIFDVQFEIMADRDLTVPANDLTDTFRVGFRNENKVEGYDLLTDPEEVVVATNKIRVTISYERLQTLVPGIYNFEVYNDNDEKVIVRGQLQYRTGIVPHA